MILLLEARLTKNTLNYLLKYTKSNNLKWARIADNIYALKLNNLEITLWDYYFYYMLTIDLINTPDLEWWVYTYRRVWPWQRAWWSFKKILSGPR